MIILSSIAISSGAAGGAINYVLKYRSGRSAIVSKREIINPAYTLEIEYSNYIEVGDPCNIKVTSYWTAPPAVAPQIMCYIFVKGQEESSFPINIGQDDQHKEVKEVSYAINDKDAHLIIQEGTTALAAIKINVTKRSLGRDIGAGADSRICHSPCFTDHDNCYFR